jgi:hypothetical protein
VVVRRRRRARRRRRIAIWVITDLPCWRTVSI